MKLNVTITLSRDWQDTPIHVTLCEELPGAGFADDSERYVIAKALQDFGKNAHQRAIAQLDAVYDAAHAAAASDLPGR